MKSSGCLQVWWRSLRWYLDFVHFHGGVICFFRFFHGFMEFTWIYHFTYLYLFMCVGHYHNLGSASCAHFSFKHRRLEFFMPCSESSLNESTSIQQATTSACFMWSARTWSSWGRKSTGPPCNMEKKETGWHSKHESRKTPPNVKVAEASNSCGFSASAKCISYDQWDIYKPSAAESKLHLLALDSNINKGWN